MQAIRDGASASCVPFHPPPSPILAFNSTPSLSRAFFPSGDDGVITDSLPPAPGRPELVGAKHHSDHGGGLLQPLLLGITSNTSKHMEASGQCSWPWSWACQAFPDQKIHSCVCRNHEWSFESGWFRQGPCSPGIPCKRRGCSPAGHSFHESRGGREGDDSRPSGRP